MPKHRIPSFSSLLSPKVRGAEGQGRLRGGREAGHAWAAVQTTLPPLHTRAAWEPPLGHTWHHAHHPKFPPKHDPKPPASPLPDHQHPQQEGHGGGGKRRAAPRVLHRVPYRQGPPAQGTDVRGASLAALACGLGG
jgi:hypothetical protein